MPADSTYSTTRSPHPRVTVLMPAYNAERFIAQAIQSVLDQTFTDFELLVIDDASSDTTPDIIHGFGGDTRLRVTRHADNVGRPLTRNHGLDLAKGEYIAFLDADDCCAPQRLATQVAYLDARADIDGVGSWKAWIDEDGRTVGNEIRRFPLDGDAIACGMLAQCTLGQTSMMVRSAAFEGYRYDSAFPVAEDYELWARMIATRRFANLAKTLTYYRRHAKQSISAHKLDQQVSDRAIYARQVAALGVQYSDDDLLRHERLFNFASRQSVFERTGAPLDIAYLRWARRWLKALGDGNASARIYPEPAFSRALAARWLFAASKARRNAGHLPVLRELAKSRLTLVALARPRQYLNKPDDQQKTPRS